MKYLIERIQENLNKNLLHPKYKKLITPDSHKFFGHCYVATEAYYHVRGKELGYKPQVMRIDENKTHWYLKKDDDIIDITKDQFPFELDYSKGRGCGFLTKKLSWRARRLVVSLFVEVLDEFNIPHNQTK